MKTTSFALDRKVPLALVFTLLLQASMAIWWASAKDAQDKHRDLRLQEIDSRLRGDQKYQLDVIDRLARLEAHAENQNLLLQQLAERPKK